MLVTISSLRQFLDVVDQNGRKRYQHLKVVFKTFRLQDLSPISMKL